MAHLLGRGPSISWQKDSRYRTTSHTTEERLTQILGLSDLRSPAPLLCLAFLFLFPTHARTHSGLDGSGRSWATSGLWQVMDDSGLCHLLAFRANAKGPCWNMVQLLPCADLLVHLEFPKSFLATLLKLPGKLLWLKISSSTPGMSALMWMWMDYIPAAEIFPLLGKSQLITSAIQHTGSFIRTHLWIISFTNTSFTYPQITFLRADATHYKRVYEPTDSSLEGKSCWPVIREKSLQLLSSMSLKYLLFSMLKDNGVSDRSQTSNQTCSTHVLFLQCSLFKQIKGVGNAASDSNITVKQR